MKEADIRPKELLEKYHELCLKDAQAINHLEFVEIHCPGCSSESSRLKFKKNGFAYVQCTDCGSLYCSPRPTIEALNRFYENSQSAQYWANVFFPAVAEARKEKLFRKKALEISKNLSINGNKDELSICDVGAGYGIFLEELQKVFPDSTLYAIEPCIELAEICRKKGISTLVSVAEDANEWKDRFDLVISSEVIEHVFSPEEFVKSLYNLSRPGGTVIMTGLGYEGFDILVLQEKSNSIFPPLHINFLSLDGFEVIFKRAGFNKIEVWTPGVLDVDIVLNSGSAPEFLQVMTKRQNALSDFQSFLSNHNMSSHVWVIGIK